MDNLLDILPFKTSIVRDIFHRYICNLPRVREDENVLFGLVPQVTQTTPKPLGHLVDFMVSQPAVLA